MEKYIGMYIYISLSYTCSGIVYLYNCKWLPLKKVDNHDVNLIIMNPFGFTK